MVSIEASKDYERQDLQDKKIEWLKTQVVLHEKRLLRFLTRFVSEEPARDIVQDAFLKLWKESLENVEGRETEWLFTVCRNQALDLLRREKRVKSEPIENVDLASTDLPADKNIEAGESQSKVTKAISQLTASQQEVIRLKFQEGFSYKDISKITGHSISHIGVLIHEAMKVLKSEVTHES